MNQAYVVEIKPKVTLVWQTKVVWFRLESCSSLSRTKLFAMKRKFFFESNSNSLFQTQNGLNPTQFVLHQTEINLSQTKVVLIKLIWVAMQGAKLDASRFFLIYLPLEKTNLPLA